MKASLLNSGLLIAYAVDCDTLFRHRNIIMNIKNVVIHEIIKNDREISADIYLTDELLNPAEPQLVDLISKLDKSFAEKTVRRAVFCQSGAFRTTIGDFSRIDLVLSSRILSQALKDRIENIAAAKGGYLIFCEYKTTRNFFSVFMVRNTRGSLLENDISGGRHSWVIREVEHVEPKNFAMGIRINLDILNNPPNAHDQKDRYLQFVPGSTDISEYFMNWVGVEKRINETKDGETLFDIIGKIALPPGIKNRSELKKSVFDYGQAKQKLQQPINLGNLSTFLFENEEVIKKYCEANQIDIDGEFHLKGAQLRKFYKVAVLAGGIKLEANMDMFSKQGIHVSDDRDKVIIRSKELAEEILNQLDNAH